MRHLDFAVRLGARITVPATTLVDIMPAQMVFLVHLNEKAAPHYLLL
jgi:hypothetical protein